MGGHSSLLAVRHHQFVHEILKSVVCLKFITTCLGRRRENVKQKNEKALDKRHKSI
jgi:hypothetical protein